MRNDRLSGFNPLRGLDLAGAVNLFEQGERGYYADLMWLYRLVLRRNGVARAVRRKLASALGRLDWNIKIPDDLEGSRFALAEKQQDALRKAYDGIQNFNDAIVHLAMADIMGFAHCEKVYAKGGGNPWAVKELRIVPQWHFCRDGLFAPWQYNPEAQNTNRGTPIDRRHWIIREIDDPAAEIFTIAHLKLGDTDAAWAEFCETYAVPPIFVIQPPNVPRDREGDYQDTAEKIVSDGRGSLPNGADVKSLQSGTDGVSVFVERLRYYREEIVLAGTGGMLTVLDGETGLGKGASDNHDDTWLDIAAAIGSAISTTLQLGFDIPTLERIFPDQERLAYFALDKPERDRAPGDVLADAKAAREAGYIIEGDELSEKTGYKLERDQANPITTTTATGSPETAAPAPGGQPPAPEEGPEVEKMPAVPETPKQSSAGEPKASLVQAALAEDLDLESRWLAPVAELFAEIEAMLADPAIPIETIAAKIETAAKTMPELLGKLDVDSLATALEKASGPAAVEGLADGLRAKTKTLES